MGLSGWEREWNKEPNFCFWLTTVGLIFVVNQLFPVGCQCEMTYDQGDIQLWIVQLFFYKSFCLLGLFVLFLSDLPSKHSFVKSTREQITASLRACLFSPSGRTHHSLMALKMTCKNSFTWYLVTFTNISHSKSQSTMLPKNLKPVKISSHIIINSRNKIRIR